MPISAERVRTRKSATIMDLDPPAKGLVRAAVTCSRKETADISHPKDYVPDHAEAKPARRSSTKEQVQCHHDAGLILGRPTTVHSPFHTSYRSYRLDQSRLKSTAVETCMASR
ncbi:hypothetical protein E4U13_003171 [Claviceps humidiphila]|uniref:Uncharacterized protein n=1 Tax=Claviceps humidiphila TaxID=1294629 RepID=A0A9P7Q8I5_9HYPO|nr:hypothetical protein E4U13_003171 [Claviceps humidiphila]